MTSHSEIIHILHSKGINLSEYEKKGSVKFIRYYETEIEDGYGRQYCPAVIDNRGRVWSFFLSRWGSPTKTLFPITRWENETKCFTEIKGFRLAFSHLTGGNTYKSNFEELPNSNMFTYELPPLLYPLIDEFVKSEGVFGLYSQPGQGSGRIFLNQRFIRAMASLQPIAKYLKQIEFVAITDECLRKERSRQGLDLANEMLNEAKERLDRSTSEEMRRRARISLQTAEEEVEHAEREEMRAKEAFEVAISAAEHLGAERLERSALADLRTHELQVQLEAEIVRNKRLNESLEAAISAETARGRERDATLGARIQALEGQVQSLQAQLKQKEAEEARARALRHAVWQKEEEEKLEREAFRRSYF